MSMIKLTRIHWNTKEVMEHPLFVNFDFIVWMEREISGESTHVSLQGYDFHVSEKPEEIIAAITAYRRQ